MTDVTPAALFQITDDVNEEHRKKIAAGGAAGSLPTPPGMAGTDP